MMVVYGPLSKKRLELDHIEKPERDNQWKNVPQHESRLLNEPTQSQRTIRLRSVDAEANEEKK